MDKTALSIVTRQASCVVKIFKQAFQEAHCHERKIDATAMGQQDWRGDRTLAIRTFE